MNIASVTELLVASAQFILAFSFLILVIRVKPKDLKKLLKLLKKLSNQK